MYKLYTEYSADVQYFTVQGRAVLFSEGMCITLRRREVYNSTVIW